MQDELRTNKIAGAILGTALAIVILRQGAEMVFAQGEAPAKPGYAITVAPEASAGGDAEPADTPPDWGTVLASADVAAGATVSAKCQSCHNFANGGPNQIGPNLWGVIGRKPGSHPGFAYSSGMVGEGDKIPVWDYEHIYEFLKGPQAYVSGTKMSFVGLKQRDDRINLIAWLRQQSSSPMAVPAPNPAAAAPAAAADATPTAAGAATAPADAGSTPAPAAGVATDATPGGSKAPAAK